MPPIIDPPSNSVAHSSSNVSWQIDIPNFVGLVSSLVARLGMEGLKSLQLSGVDIHTIASIIALGEVSPACIEFRNSLHVKRKKQRTQTWWIHALVEYGSGTNFVVDELLKTRAGENVLALITAVASVYEDAFGTILTLLYDKLKIPSHSTPSLGQLDNLRSLCVPLAREMDFKDRLVETQAWIENKFGSMGRPPYPAMEDALPEAATMADLVTTLAKIAAEWEVTKTILAYYGTKGAAWVINYSWNVLRLPVCVVDANGNPEHEISGLPYSSCAVILYPGSSGPPEILQNIQSASEVVVLQNTSDTLSSATNWLISCRGDEGVDVIQLLCGWNVSPVDRQELGNMMFTIANELIQFRLGLTAGERNNGFYNPNTGLIPITLERILLLVGLPGGFRSIPRWRETHIVATREKDVVEMEMFNRMTVLQDGSPQMCTHGFLWPSEMEDRPFFCVRCRITTAIQNVAYLSSTLAFTDWGDHFCMLSARWFNEEIRYISPWWRPLMSWTVGMAPSGLSGFPATMMGLDHNSLAYQVGALCSGSAQGYPKALNNRDRFLGIDIDSMLLILYRAIETSLRPGPVLIIRSGEFNLQGDRRTVLTEQYSIPIRKRREPVDLGSGSNTLIVAPRDEFVDSRLTMRVTLLKESIELRYTVETPTLDPVLNTWGFVSVVHVQKMLLHLGMASPCSHSIDEPISLTRVPSERCRLAPPHQGPSWRDSANRLWLAELGLSSSEMAKEDVGDHSICHYSPTTGNHLAQWAVACHLTWVVRPKDATKNVFVLQDSACLRCTLDQAEQWKPSKASQVFMICG
jgi:hypothetical protein